MSIFFQSLSNGVNDNAYDEDGGTDDFQKPKSNEKKDKKVKRAEEKRRQKEAKRVAAAAEAAQADYIPGAARPQQDRQPQVTDTVNKSLSVLEEDYLLLQKVMLINLKKLYFNPCLKV
jgi:hypothetical protein